jgi:type 1 glutamine amidotransferase
VKVTNREHPVTWGLEDFVIHDEGYSNLDLSEGITPLLETGHPECTTPLAWVNHCDRSTIVFLMLGHDRQAYQHASFRQLLTNSLHWLAGEKVP